MRLAETVEAIAVALELFPMCVKCGGMMDATRLTKLVQVAGRPNRHAHNVCPQEAA